jgi:hypothetical protein
MLMAGTKYYRCMPVLAYMPNEGNQLGHWIEGQFLQTRCKEIYDA